MAILLFVKRHIFIPRCRVREIFIFILYSGNFQENCGFSKISNCHNFFIFKDILKREAFLKSSN
jgi:hypothetical protein